MGRSCYVYKRGYKRLLARIFDAAGGLFFFPGRYGPDRLAFTKVKRILVVRLDHLGDVAMTWPSVKALERIFPEAKIDILVSEETAPLLKDGLRSGEVLTVKNHWFGKSATGREQFIEALSLSRLLRKRKYDLAIDFRGDLRNIILMFSAGVPLRLGFGITGGGFLLTHQGRYEHSKHRVELNAELLRFCEKDFEMRPEPFLYSETRKEEFWSRVGMMPREDNYRRILIHPAASCPSKQWPLERFRKLIARLIKDDFIQLILIGTQAEKEVFAVEEDGQRVVDLRGRTAIADLPILMEVCDLFVGNDSGPAHIAAAQGKYVVSIFSGTNRAEVWRPWTSRLWVVQHTVPCSPCEARTCPLGHHQCMEEISVEEVLRAVQSVLEDVPRHKQRVFSKNEPNAESGAIS